MSEAVRSISSGPSRGTEQKLRTEAGHFVNGYFNRFWEAPTSPLSRKIRQLTAEGAPPDHIPDGSVDPDKVQQVAAYQYLVELFLARNEKMGDRKLTGKALEEKITELFDGLTRYFSHADEFQEKLIEVNVTASRKVLLEEAFFMMLDSARKPGKRLSKAGLAALLRLPQLEGVLKGGAIPSTGEILQNPAHLAALLRYARDTEHLVRKELSMESLTVAEKRELEIKESLQLLENDLTEQELRDVLKKTVGNLFKSWQRPEPDVLDSVDVTELLEATRNLHIETGRSNVRAKLALRSVIEDCIERLDLPPLYTDPDAVTSFRESRTKQTRALNEYEQNLESLLVKTRETLARIKKEKPQLFTRPGVLFRKARTAIIARFSAFKNSPEAEDITTLREEIIPMLEQRLQEVEDFRNGYLPKLDPQSDKIAAFELYSRAACEVFEESGRGSVLAVLEDIPVIHRDLETPHPRIAALKELQDGLKVLAKGHGIRRSYEHNPPGVALMESGIKSWKRTVEKLVNEQGCQWGKMTDLSRMGVLFGRVENMYRYNAVLREVARAADWGINAPDTPGSECNDRGIILPPTGMMLWLMKLKAGEAGGHDWLVEVKLDDHMQRRVENATHKIFECARRLEGRRDEEIDQKASKRRFDPYFVTPESYENFLLHTRVTMQTLQKHASNMLPADFPTGDLAAIEKDAAQYLREGNRNYQERAGALYQRLNELHVALCCAAASQSSPGMQALYRLHFDEMLEPLQEQHDKLDSGREKDALAKKIASLRAIDERFGPKPFSEKNTRGYKSHHLNLAKGLRDQFTVGWDQAMRERVTVLQ